MTRGEANAQTHQKRSSEAEASRRQLRWRDNAGQYLTTDVFVIGVEFAGTCLRAAAIR